LIFDCSFYCSEDEEKACEITGLDLDELESIVGRFKSHSVRKGKLRGEILIGVNGDIVIRHHFSKKILWSSYE
jgi:hypothetical protein